MTGWILLHRRFLEWEWYDDINTKVVFLHCLLRANFEDQKYRGMLIKRGQFVTGRDKFAKEVSLSPQKIRTCWDKLKSTGEIDVKSTSSGSIVTVCNYNTYQDAPKKNNQRVTNDQPTSNQQVTTIKERKELKEGKINIPFSDFWDLYDHKKGSKPDAEKKWCKLSDSDRETIMRLLPGYVSSFSDKKYQPYPATFLNQRRWESEDEMKPQEMRIYA